MKVVKIKSTSSRYNVRSIMLYLCQDRNPTPMPLKELVDNLPSIAARLSRDLWLDYHVAEDENMLSLCFADPLYEEVFIQ